MATSSRAAGVLRAAAPPGTWWATVHLMVGLPVGLFTAAALLVTGAGVLFPAGVAVLTQMQRSRFRALLDVDIPPLREATTDLRAAATWRQLGYHVLAPAIGLAGFLAAATGWSTGLALTGVVVYFPTLPRDGYRGWDLHAPVIVALLTGAGATLLVIAAFLARALARLDAAVARRLLGPSAAEVLAARMEVLARSRAEGVEAAYAERRRIERDLHDGTQQRLVVLAMRLGMARSGLSGAPEPARQAVGRAHDEAKEILAELRDFVRGLHPAVLTDKGLDAALSGVVARVPIPVRLHVDAPRRCAPAIEAIAYFVVSELLTNVTRHAWATSADVSVVAVGDRLRITVVDDGRGGAAERPGGGLRGLAQRAASVDGTLEIDSPPGGPTAIVVELPCAS